MSESTAENGTFKRSKRLQPTFTKASRKKAQHAKDLTKKRVYRGRLLTDADHETNRRKSSVRSYVEHAFGISEGQFGFHKHSGALANNVVLQEEALMPRFSVAVRETEKRLEARGTVNS